MSIKVDRQAADILRVADEEVLTHPARFGRKTGKGRFTLAGAVMLAAGPLHVDAGEEAANAAHEAVRQGFRVAVVSEDLETFRGAKATLTAARTLIAHRISIHEAKIARARDKRVAARRKAQREARKAARLAAVSNPAPKVRDKAKAKQAGRLKVGLHLDPKFVRKVQMVGKDLAADIERLELFADRSEARVAKVRAKPVSRTRAAVAASKAKAKRRAG